FTLIEFLVVIAIIAILAAILFPVFAKAREKARTASCQNNIKQILLALFQYANDYDEKFPYWRTQCWGGWQVQSPRESRPFWTTKVQPYIKNEQVFMCPSTERAGWPSHCWPGAVRTSYGYNELIQNDCCGYTKLAKFKYPAESVLVADSLNAFFPPHCGGGCSWIHPWIAFPTGFDRGQLKSNPSADYSDWTIHNGGSNLGFVDGHVKWVTWRKINYKRRGGVFRMHPRDPM
ncbi:MAG TPA: DUF1559 domain-containing protein, partial [Armatimonadetes bacterium]|nr:DUF1559 domain-containing protein [Armatimonadota bacterium]